MDRLSGVDVRGVLRRTRLSLVASLFVALLGGAGATVSAVEPAPVPVVSSVVAPTAVAPVTHTASAPLPPDAPTARPATVAVPPLPATAPARLTSQVSGFAGGPRAPPTTA
ncbi:hypothetical protein AB0J80_36285 [Actinoplanes sp. NPDC049548]|uniref:hypothetical protein n=1 Tax=Actinoplanes sp. NPDC049548 TaxID=3155152 RepID=UPI00342E80BE